MLTRCNVGHNFISDKVQRPEGIILYLRTPFNDISVISWWSVLLVEDTRVPREIHRPATSGCINDRDIRRTFYTVSSLTQFVYNKNLDSKFSTHNVFLE